VLIDDLRGSVTGTLDGTALPDLSGAFGPVTVSGELDMSPVTAELNLTLAETDIVYAAGARAPLAVTASVLSVQGGVASWQGTLVTPGVTVGPVALAPGTMTANALFGGAAGSDPASTTQPWSLDLRSEDGSLAVAVTSTSFALDLTDLPITSSSADLPVAALLSGTIAPSLRADAGLAAG